MPVPENASVGKAEDCSSEDGTRAYCPAAACLKRKNPPKSRGAVGGIN